MDAEPVQVEVDITNGLEKLTVVGLPDAAVRESGERVRSAISNSGYIFPQQRLTVNLAPVDVRKEGPAPKDKSTSTTTKASSIPSTSQT